MTRMNRVLRVSADDLEAGVASGVTHTQLNEHLKNTGLTDRNFKRPFRLRGRRADAPINPALGFLLLLPRRAVNRTVHGPTSNAGASVVQENRKSRPRCQQNLILPC